MDDSYIDDSFVRFWNSLGEKPNTTIRIFDKQDFYVAHFEDAEYLARSFFKSTEVIKYKKGSATAPYVNINKNAAEGVFRHLLVSNHFKVEVYNSRGKDGNCTLDYTVSPGNLEKYQDILFNNADVSASNTLLALNVVKSTDSLKIYIGFVDLDSGLFMVGSVTEVYAEYEQLSNLSSALFQITCRECLIQSNDSRPESIAVKNTLEQAGFLVTERKKSEFSTENLSSILPKLVCKSKFGNDNFLLKFSEMEGESAMECLNAIIQYLGLANDESALDFFDLQSFKLDAFMQISEESSRSMNIFTSQTDINKYDSLYGLLNSCRTNLGEKLLLRWMKQPLMNVYEINQRLDMVEFLVTDNDVRVSLYDNHLRRIPDMQRITKRVFRKSASLQDLFKLYQALKQINEIYSLLHEHTGQYRDVISSEFAAFKDLLESTNNFVNMVENTIDFDAIKTNHDYRVRADIDENLQECNSKLSELTVKIEKEFTTVADHIGLESRKQVKLELSNNLGYFMRVSRKDEKVLRDRKKLQVIETLKDGVKFHSPNMAALNETYQKYRFDYEEFQRNIVDEIMRISNEYSGSMHKLSLLVAKLDVFCSLAVAALSAPGNYVRPVISSENTRHISLINCRHPIVEMQQNVSYIPNDVYFDEKNTFQIITGPNMGGKSTYLRSVAMTVFLAQIGSFVPCEQAELSVFDTIMTRIGAGDCQLKGVSTFMAEMLDMSWIIKNASRRSLIIVDELGRGTSTFDGFGLAWAISEHLAVNLRAFTIFATHFHELTDLSITHDNVVNLHVAAQTISDKLVFLYKVEQGPSMKSFGIEVGKIAGLPENVINYAKTKLDEYENVMEWDRKCLSQDELHKTRKVISEFCEMDVGKNSEKILLFLKDGLLH